MKNLSIMIKFLSIMAFFGAFALGVAFYSTSQMRGINNGYTALLSGDATAAIAIARANRNFQSGHSGIADLEIAIDESQNAAAKALIDASTRKFSQYMDTATSADPAEADTLSALKAQALAVFSTQCAPAISAGDSATTPQEDAAAQQIYLGGCAPAFGPLTQAMADETSKIVSATSQSGAALATVTSSTILLTYGGIIGGLALVMAAGFFTIRSGVIRPVQALQDVMARLAAGDFKTNVPGAERRDEIGGMARAVQVFKEAGLEKLRLEQVAKDNAKAAEAAREMAEQERMAVSARQATVMNSLADGLDRLARGDLVFRLTSAFSAEYEKLRTDFNAAVEQLQQTVAAIAANTHGVRAGAGEITQASDDLARRTEQQAASLEETAAALDEITATVRKTAQGATEARDVVTAAKSDAERSGDVVREAVAAMGGIEGSSKQIGSIIGVIDEIAFQTNLLALNAGVEAARAGDAGRGFAVVATEVRALAQRSADAAKEIKTLISASGAQVATGVKLVGETGMALTRIVEQVSRLNMLVTEIAGSAQEQATGLAEVNSAVNQMDQVTQQNAAMVEQTTAASHSLSREAEELARLVAKFEVGAQAPPPALPPVTATRKPAPAVKKPRAPVSAPAGKFVAIAHAGPRAAVAGEDWDEF